MENRSPIILMLSCLIVLLFLAALGTGDRMDSCANQESSLPNAVSSINQRNSSAKSVHCPSIKMGLVSSSSLYYEKGGDMIFSTHVFGVKEAMVGCRSEEYWFWIRSFDKESVYFCPIENLDATTLRPLMMPEAISMIGWIGEIEASSSFTRSSRGFISSKDDGRITFKTEFTADRILSQTILVDGSEILTMEGGNYRSFSGHMMPTKINVTWNEEGLFGTFQVREWVINPERQDASAPEGMRRISLEDYFSS